jgi:hypothetical protein
MSDDSESDWPGQRAKEFGVPLGKIGCPHCGGVLIGVLTPVCKVCGKAYWSDPCNYVDPKVIALITISKWLVGHEIKSVTVADVVALVNDLLKDSTR